MPLNMYTRWCSSLHSLIHTHCPILIDTTQYAYKGHACTSVTVHPVSDPDNSLLPEERERDETKSYLDGHYLCAPKPFWSLVAWPTHHVSDVRFCTYLLLNFLCWEYPPIMQLLVHLENEKYVIFNEDDPDVADCPWDTHLTAFFKANKQYPEAHTICYPNFPSKFT